MTEHKMKIEQEVIDDIYLQMNVNKPKETFQQLLEESLIKRAYMMGYNECSNQK